MRASTAGPADAAAGAVGRFCTFAASGSFGLLERSLMAARVEPRAREVEPRLREEVCFAEREEPIESVVDILRGCLSLGGRLSGASDCFIGVSAGAGDGDGAAKGASWLLSRLLNDCWVLLNDGRLLRKDSLLPRRILAGVGEWAGAARAGAGAGARGAGAGVGATAGTASNDSRLIEFRLFMRSSKAAGPEAIDEAARAGAGA